MKNELISKVTLSCGKVIEIRMPTMSDIEGIFLGQIPSNNTAYYLCAQACGMSIDDFRKLSVTDGMLVFSKVNPAMEAMNNYLTGAANVN